MWGLVGSWSVLCSQPGIDFLLCLFVPIVPQKFNFLVMPGPTYEFHKVCWGGRPSDSYCWLTCAVEECVGSGRLQRPQFCSKGLCFFCLRYFPVSRWQMDVRWRSKCVCNWVRIEEGAKKRRKINIDKLGPSAKETPLWHVHLFNTKQHMA